MGFEFITGPNFITPATVNIRKALTANTTYYLRTDGSDNNAGLQNTASGAFLTFQHAINVISSIDAGAFNVTLQFGNSGTYVGANVFGPLLISAGTFLITGDVTTPTNVVITGAPSGNSIGVFQGANVQISGLSLTTPGFACLQVSSGAQVQCVDKMDFGSSLYHLESQLGGSLFASGISYSISGSPTAAHVRPNNLGYIDTSFSTINFSTDITTTQFVLSELNSIHKATSMTFTLNGHTVTGSKYTVRNNAVINTGTGNVNYFPGSTAGTGTNSGTSPFGLYL